MGKKPSEIWIFWADRNSKKGIGAIQKGKGKKDEHQYPVWVCCSRKKFSQGFRKESQKELKYIIILCELGWTHDRNKIQLSDMGGIELGQHLRLEDVTVPILFVSALSRAEILNDPIARQERQIIVTPALKHGFEQLKLNTALENQKAWIEKLKSMFPEDENFTLCDFELEYTKDHFCNIEGAIKRMKHDMGSNPTQERLRGYYMLLEKANTSGKFNEELAKKIKCLPHQIEKNIGTAVDVIGTISDHIENYEI